MYRTYDVFQNGKIEPNFEPSTKILIRILKTISDKGAEAKTALSLDTNLNYTRFAKYIAWLEKKSFVKSTIDGSKIKVSLTKKGREFASTLSND